MAMMIDILDKSIKDMKDLRQREERRDNKAAQEALDQRFSVLTSENGRIITNKRAALLISNVIKKMMKLPLSKEEQMAEEKLKKIVG